MTWNLSPMLVIGALAATGGCGQLAPERTAPAPAPAAAAAAPDVRPHAGQTYSEFVAAAGASYSPDALSIPATDRVRLWRGMAEATPSALLSGGGAEALVFRGCSEQGCEEGVSIVAIDVATGAAFAGVRDVGGADVLAPNERVEALLRLNSPTRAWDNPEAAQP
jgi:hypothetical protein